MYGNYYSPQMCNVSSNNMDWINMSGPSYRMPKLTKGMVIQDIRQSVMAMTGHVVTKEEKLDDATTCLRHCCLEGKGISYLPAIPYTVFTTGVQFGVHFCSKCGKLYYPREIPV